MPSISIRVSGKSKVIPTDVLAASFSGEPAMIYVRVEHFGNKP